MNEHRALNVRRYAMPLVMDCGLGILTHNTAELKMIGNWIV